MFVKNKKKLEVYIGQEFDNPGDIQTSIEDLKEVTIEAPREPAGYGNRKYPKITPKELPTRPKHLCTKRKYNTIS